MLRLLVADCCREYLQQAAVAANVRNRDDYQAVVDPEQPHAPRQSGPSPQCQLMNSQEPSSSHARAWAIASSYESERPSDSAAANAMAPNASRARSINTSSPGSG